MAHEKPEGGEPPVETDGEPDVKLSVEVVAHGLPRIEGIPVDVIPLDTGLTRAGRRRRTARLVMPTGTATEVSLPEGRYLVQAQLPNGRELSQEVDTNTVKTVTLVAPGTANEWRAWPGLLEGREVGQQQVKTRRVRGQPPRTLARQQRVRGQQVELVGAGHGAAAPTWKASGGDATEGEPQDVAPRSVEMPGLESLTAEHGPGEMNTELAVVVARARKVQTHPILAPGAQEYGSAGLRLGVDWQLADDCVTVFARCHSEPWLQGKAFFEERYFLQIDDDDDARGRSYLALPLSWSNEDGSPVEIQIRLPDRENRPRVYVQDPVMGPALAQLAAGRLSALQRTRELVEGAARGLAMKFRNPVRAAAAAYVLLKLQAFEAMHDWAGALADNFPWLVDARIVHATVLLESRIDDGAAHEQALAVAERYLVGAAQTGVPFFTEGVRLLARGLRRLTGGRSPSDATRAALATAERLELGCEPDSLFTWLHHVELSDLAPGKLEP